jgi:hypothetical protein
VAVSRVGCGELTLASSPVTAKFPRSCYIVPMPTNLHRYYGAGYSHFITTSCYQRRPLLGPPRARDFFLEVVEQIRQGHQFVVVGYVVMPEPSFTSTKSPDPHRHRGPPVKPPRVGHPVAERWETSRPLLSFSPRN